MPPKSIKMAKEQVFFLLLYRYLLLYLNKIVSKKGNDMPNNNVFSSNEILELCNSIKDIHQVLKTVGKFYNEIDASENQNDNAFLKDCKKWGKDKL